MAADSFLTACLFTKLLRRDILVPLRKQPKRGVVAHDLCVPMFVITFSCREPDIGQFGLNKTFCMVDSWSQVCKRSFFYSHAPGVVMSSGSIGR